MCECMPGSPVDGWGVWRDWKLSQTLADSYFILRLGSGEQSNLRVRQIHMRAHAFTHSENESIWCMLDRFMGAGLWAPFIPHWLLQSELGSRGIFGQEARSRCLFPLLQLPGSRVAVHFSPKKMINVHANYQSMGTHSNTGDRNQETVIWKTIHFYLRHSFTRSYHFISQTHVLSPLLSFSFAPSIY